MGRWEGENAAAWKNAFKKRYKKEKKRKTPRILRNGRVGSGQVRSGRIVIWGKKMTPCLGIHYSVVCIKNIRIEYIASYIWMCE